MTSATAAVRAVGPAWSFGDKLRKVRRDIAGMSQTQMADLLAVNPATYSAWEGGRAKPQPRVAEALAQRLEVRFAGQVSAAWLLGYHPVTAYSQGSPTYLWLIGEEPAGQSHDVGLLPRMDSNHQPPDSRHQIMSGSNFRMLLKAHQHSGITIKSFDRRARLAACRSWGGLRHRGESM